MSRGVNKAIVLGHLGADPDVRYMPNGKAVTNIRVATSEQWTDKSGDKQEKTEWHNVVVYDKIAEVVGEYCHKGSQIYVEGKLQTRKWQDKDGNDRYTTEIVASNITLLGGGQGNGGEREERQSRPSNRSEGTTRGGTTRGARPAQNSNRGTTSRNGSTTGRSRQPAPTPTEDFDDDIPFGDEQEWGSEG